MSHLNKIMDCRASNHVRNSRNFQKGDFRSNEVGATKNLFPSITEQEHTNRIHRTFNKRRSLSPGLIVVEYRTDELMCGDRNSNHLLIKTITENASSSINNKLKMKKRTSRVKSENKCGSKKTNHLVTKTIRENASSSVNNKLEVKKLTSGVKSDNKCGGMNYKHQLIKTLTKKFQYIPLTKKNNKIALPIRDVMILKDETLKLTESKKSKTAPRPIKHKRVRYSVATSVSKKHFRKHRRHKLKRVLKHVEITYQDQSTQGPKIQYKTARDLVTEDLRIQDLNTQDQNRSAEINLQRIFRNGVAKFVDGFVETFFVGFALIVTDILLNPNEYLPKSSSFFFKTTL